jgi:subtilisin family serine protease
LKNQALVVLLGLMVGGCGGPELVDAPAPVAATPAGAQPVTNRWLVEFASPSLSRGGQKPQHELERQKLQALAADAHLDLEITTHYGRLWNGVAVRLPAAQVAALSALPIVTHVFPVLQIERDPGVVTPADGSTADLFSAVKMTGADVAQGTGLTGQGVRVGVIDTGLDYGHPDFGACAAIGGSCRVQFGTDLVGDAYDAATAGSVPVPDADPMDCGGHGTHVAGIIGAHGVVTGVAPQVTFGAYRVFGCTGSTDSAIMLQAMELAAADEMRVVNMSIGSAFAWPEYPNAVAASALAAEGVVVVASAGNSGTNGLYAVGAPSVSPDTLAVASVDNTAVAGPAFKLNGATLVGYAAASGSPLPPSSGTQPLTRTGTTASTADACTALAAGSLAGKVALVRRGTCPFYSKAINVQNAGAIGLLLYNNVAGALAPTVAGTPAVTIPVVGLSQADGAVVDAAIAAGASSLTWGAFTTSVPNATTAGLVSSFSSWGPTAELTLKPDLSAPGGNIYSTWPRALGSYASLSGTSMASPHVAGTVALLLQAQPTLAPVELMNLLRNTAVPALAAGGNLDAVFHQGAGLVRIDRAATTLASVTPALLALGESQAGPATRRLTVTNRAASPLTFVLTHTPALSVNAGSTYTPTTTTAGAATVAFSVPSLVVPAGGSASVDVTVTADAAAANGLLYGGYVVFTSQDSSPVVLRVPYAGFKGDYQALQVLVPTAKGYPWLANSAGVQQASGATFTMVSGDVAHVVVHFEQHARVLRGEIFDAVSGKPWGLAFEENWAIKAATATATATYQWDGTTQFNKQQVLVPNGTYVIKVSALKPLGDAATSSDWETWTSPVVTVNHP